VPRRPRAPFVALPALLRHRFPDLDDPLQAIADGRVHVDGRVVTNAAARVRRDAAVRVRPRRLLRGQRKLAAALDAFAIAIAIAESGDVAVDVGAAAGGFTAALLERGARRVYAVDVGHGQLRGELRHDPRVIPLERTNVGDLDDHLVPEPVDIVTLDLSYLSVADAVPSLDALRFAPGAMLLALVKPTFELRAGSLVTDATEVRAAVRAATDGIEANGWRPLACTLPATTGAGGAVEAFVLAARTP
jgi:23S rRNA (cytidine1920-2'-O)/16S rRNA (cytidine1409-2'-O)-methyltransferase